MFLSLEKVKRHLNIDEYFHEDDEYLNHLILVAEKVVEKHIDCDFSGLMDDLGNLPSPILHAMLLFIGDMYQSRESVSFASAQELPLSFRYLLDLYMDYSGDENRKPDRPKVKVQEKPKEEIKPEPEYPPLEPMRPPKVHNKPNHHDFDGECHNDSSIEVNKIEVIK